MSETNHKKLAAFLRDELDRKEHRQPIRIELIVSPPNARSETIQAWDRELDERYFGVGYADGTAADILRIAEDYADGRGPGTYRFAIRIGQYLGGQTKTTFRVLIEDEQEEGGENLVPNQAGIVAQQMRHTEFMTRALGQNMQAVTMSLREQIKDLQTEIVQLRAERRDMLKIAEEAESSKDARELEGIKQINSDKRKDLAFDKMLQLAPVIANRIAGHEAVPMKESPRDMMINAFSESIQSNPEQIQKLMSVLDVQQQIILIELFRSASPVKKNTQDPQGVPPKDINGSSDHG